MSIEIQNERRIQLSSHTQNLIAGTFAGMAQTFTGHPFDTIKVRMQTHEYKNTMDCLRQTMKGEGFLALYKGMSSPLIASTLFTSIMFGSYESFRQYFCRDPNHKFTFVEFTISCCATGFIETLLYTPFEHLKIKLQTQYDQRQSLVRLTKDIVRQTGFLSLFRGFTAELMRECPGNMAYFGTYGILREFIKPYEERKQLSEKSGVFLAGGFAGVAYWGLIFPFDTIKSRLQADSIQTPKYHGLVHCIKLSYKEIGITGLFRGVSPCLVRAFPVNAASFLAFEHVKQFLEKM